MSREIEEATEKQQCIRRTEKAEEEMALKGEGDGLCQMLLLGRVT